MELADLGILLQYGVAHMELKKLLLILAHAVVAKIHVNSELGLGLAVRVGVGVGEVRAIVVLNLIVCSTVDYDC